MPPISDEDAQESINDGWFGCLSNNSLCKYGVLYAFVERFHLQNTPEISHDDARIYFMINLITGGIGTMIAGLHAKKFKLPSDGKYEKTGEYADMNIIYMGLLQCLTAPLFFGWIWGVLYMWTVV